MASTFPPVVTPSVSATSDAIGTYGPQQVRASGTSSDYCGLPALHAFAFEPDMTDLVLSNPDLVRDVLEADRELREGRGEFLSLEEAFGE